MIRPGSGLGLSRLFRISGPFAAFCNPFDGSLVSLGKTGARILVGFRIVHNPHSKLRIFSAKHARGEAGFTAEVVIYSHEGGGDHVIELPILGFGKLGDGVVAPEVIVSPHFGEQSTNQAMHLGRAFKFGVGVAVANGHCDLALFREHLTNREDPFPHQAFVGFDLRDGLEQSRDHGDVSYPLGPERSLFLMLQSTQDNRRTQNLKVRKGAYPALGRSRLEFLQDARFGQRDVLIVCNLREVRHLRSV